MLLHKLHTLFCIVVAMMLTVVSAVHAEAPVRRTLCVWDLMGANGDTFAIMKDYRIAAAAWGIDLKLKSYSDEKIATEDFRVGQCDAAVITGLRAKPFNTFVGA